MRVLRSGFAGLCLVASAASPAPAGFGFSLLDVRLACDGSVAQSLPRAGNAALLPFVAQSRFADCRLEIDYHAFDGETARDALVEAHVELMALGLTKAAFPARHALKDGSLPVALRTGGEGRLTLIVPLAALFGDDRKQGAAITLALRRGSASRVSPALFVERAEKRAKRPQLN